MAWKRTSLAERALLALPMCLFFRPATASSLSAPAGRIGNRAGAHTLPGEGPPALYRDGQAMGYGEQLAGELAELSQSPQGHPCRVIISPHRWH